MLELIGSPSLEELISDTIPNSIRLNTKIDLPKPMSEIEFINHIKEMGSPLTKKKKGKKDACYHKVKSRVKVWPSAYASGQLVQCRKRGAANWGKKSKA